MDARIAPHGSFGILSRQEVSQLLDAGAGGLYGLWRQCSLAVLLKSQQKKTNSIQNLKPKEHLQNCILSELT